MTEAAPTPKPSEQDLARLARHIVFQAGGVNSEARRRLGALALVHGLTMQDVYTLIHEIGNDEIGAPDRVEHMPAASVLPPDVYTEHDDPHDAQPSAATSDSNHATRPTLLRTSAIVMFALSAVMAARLVVIIAGTLGNSEVQNIPVQQVPSLATSTVTASAAASSQSLALPDAAILDTRELFQALANLDQRAFATQPEAAHAIFERSVAALAEHWTTLAPDIVADVTILLRDAIASAGTAQNDTRVSTEMTNQVLAPAHALRNQKFVNELSPSAVAFASAWASAVDTIRLPPDAERRVRSVRTALPRPETRRAVDGDFWRGASIGLERLALEYISHNAPMSAWESWGKTAQALSRANENEGTTTLVRALTHLMRTDLSSGDSAAGRNAITELASRVNWREHIATQALLAWFEDRNISSEQLAFTVRELAEARLVPGLAGNTRLSTDADAAARTRVRDAFALTLGQPLRATDAFAMRWRHATDDYLHTSPARRLSAAREAAAGAYLSAAAAQRTAGHDDAADNAVDLAIAAMEPPEPESRSPRDIARFGQWGQSFLGARRDEQARIEQLYLLMNNGGPSTQLEADLLAEAAAFGAPRSVQQLAQRIIIDLPEDMRLVDGLLKAVPLASTSNTGFSEVIERTTGRRMPPSGDALWTHTAQRILIERLLELRGAHALSGIGETPRMLVDAYELATSVHSSPTPSQDAAWGIAGHGSAPESHAIDPAPAAAGLWLQWHSLAERLPEGQITIAPLTELAARRAGRLLLARGPMQRFAAEQASIAELMAYVTAIEQPRRADAVMTIVRTMRTESRTVATVYEQMNTAERAIVRLWRLRMGFEENEL